MIEDSFEILSDENENANKTQFVDKKTDILNAYQFKDNENKAGLLKNIPNGLIPNELVFQANRISMAKDDGKSDSFKELKYVIDNNKEFLEDLSDIKSEFNKNDYEKFMSIYQAVSSYMTINVSDISLQNTGIYKAASIIRKQLDKIAEIFFDKKDLGAIGAADYTEEERKSAKDNVERLMEYYLKYSMRVDEDFVAEDSEKVERKWNVIKSCERDIDIYLTDKLKKANGRVSELKDKDAFLYQEYYSLKSQMLFKNKINGVEDKTNIENNEGLNQKQLAAISQIDTWLVRNFRNGGYMAIMGDASDRTDIIGKRLAMDKRKRLYIYYLVESRERVKPTAEGVIESQLSYVPDLEEFKDKMIANKMMFYKRFSGGYIYWNKLTEAMGIAAQLNPMFEKIDLLYNEKEKEKAKGNNNEINNDINNDISQDKEEMESFHRILRLALEGMRLSELNENNKVSESEKKENDKRIKDILKFIDQELQIVQAPSTSIKSDVKMFTQKAANKALSTEYVITGMLEDKVVQQWANIKAKTIKALKKYYSPTLMGLNAFSKVAGLVFSIISFKDNAKSMNWLDIASSGTDIALKTFGTVKSGASIMEYAGASNSVTKALISKTGAYVTSGADIAVAAMNTASYIKSSKSRKKASELARKMLKNVDKNDEKKMFTEGMIALNKKLGQKQKTGALGSLGLATISSTSLILLTSSVITCGISALVGALTLGFGVGMSVSDSYDAKSMKNILFDTFYKIDEEVEKEKAKWKAKNKNRYPTEKQKRNFREIIRSRIAAREGYYSPRHAAKAIANRFAEFLLEGANKQDADSKMFISFIKGLGLAYKFNKDEKKVVPKTSDIAKRLCG